MSWAKTLNRRLSPRRLSLVIGIPGLVVTGWLLSIVLTEDPLTRTLTRTLRAQDKLEKAPDLIGGTDWLNTDRPLSIHKDLKGKIVILDFWTFCCINCIHTLPDLAKLEKKYEKELVVVGVHSAKFANEKITANIRKAILRYQIRHPVVNDPDQKIWDSYNCESWPTLAVIDPDGNFLGIRQGEGNYDLLDRVIQKLIDKHRKSKTLNETPLHFTLEKEL